MLYSEILNDYLFIFEFILSRQLVVLVFVIKLQVLLDLSITKDFQEGLQTFN